MSDELFVIECRDSAGVWRYETARHELPDAVEYRDALCEDEDISDDCVRVRRFIAADTAHEFCPREPTGPLKLRIAELNAQMDAVVRERDALRAELDARGSL